MDTHKYKSSKRQRSTKESRKNKLTAHRRNPVCGTYCQGKDFFCCVLLSFLKQILQNKSAFFCTWKIMFTLNTGNTTWEWGAVGWGVSKISIEQKKSCHRTARQVMLLPSWPCSPQPSPLSICLPFLFLWTTARLKAGFEKWRGAAARACGERKSVGGEGTEPSNRLTNLT